MRTAAIHVLKDRVEAQVQSSHIADPVATATAEISKS
jgi:hypothetical protein